MQADVAQAMLKEAKTTQDKELETFEGPPSLLSVMEHTEQGVKEECEKQEEEKAVESEEENESESSSFDENDPFF